MNGTTPGEDAPLAGTSIAFTGRLASMSRSDAAKLVEKRGGRYARSVTRTTHALVIGAAGAPLRSDGRPTRKLARAESLARRGFDIAGDGNVGIGLAFRVHVPPKDSIEARMRGDLERPICPLGQQRVVGETTVGRDSSSVQPIAIQPDDQPTCAGARRFYLKGLVVEGVDRSNPCRPFDALIRADQKQLEARVGELVAPRPYRGQK